MNPYGALNTAVAFLCCQYVVEQVFLEAAVRWKAMLFDSEDILIFPLDFNNNSVLSALNVFVLWLTLV